ncbi:MAG TPA: twin-arginine translocation signal domain-containing protein, partial [Gemmata sp.]|nr:twin-arginine translocation signal domain-containing protein [Gemmata sp.]
MSSPDRRDFLSASAAAGGLAFLGNLPPVRAADAKPDPDLVRLDSGIEPLVRLLEDTPRDKLLEEVGARVKKGLAYRDVLAALLLAGGCSARPRPNVGFKFHAVLVVNSAHQAAMAGPDNERWLPLFWALDNFKSSQAQNIQESGWRMKPVDEAKVPSARKARAAFVAAMDDWDVEAADVAVAGLVRSAEAGELFDLYARYGARDFRDIGHKIIYVGNAFRTLEVIGWQHAEPVLRSLAFAILKHDGKNPAKEDLEPD